LLLLAGAGEVPAASPPSFQDAHHHLLLDPRVTDRIAGAELVLGQVVKHPRNPLFHADQPWENSLNNLYPNIVDESDAGLVKLWYKCVLVDRAAIDRLVPPHTVHGVGWLLLYATSRDGVSWEKPAVGQVAWDGSSRNNAVARDTPNVGVFRDPNPDCPQDRRYKMVYDVGLGEVHVRFSSDGVRWGPPHKATGLTARTGDTHNNAFWDQRLNKYVLVTRFVLGERLVARAESRDFIHWEPPTLALRSTFAEGRRRQTYCMPAFPYGSGYLGLVMMYNASSDRTVDCELTWSPDSVHWQRVCPGQSFIPRGAPGSCDAKCIYAQANPPVLRDGKLWCYYGGSDVEHRGWKRHCLPCVATLQPDCFAGYGPAHPQQPARIVTQPLRLTGAPLCVTMGVEPAVEPAATEGTVQVTIRSEILGELARSEPLRGNVSGAPVRWARGKRAEELRGEIVRLEFELHGATLYAFRGAELLPVPQVLPAVRQFDRVLTISVAAAAGETVRFTVDGSAPTADSPRFDKPLTVERDTVFQARSFCGTERGGGPVAKAAFRKRVPWSVAHPGGSRPAVRHAAHFDRDAEGWKATDEIEHVGQGGQAGGYVRVKRRGQQPYLLAEAAASGGAFSGDWPARFGGSGVSLRFAQRAAAPGGATRVELFAGDIAQWSLETLPAATGQWQTVATSIRHDWNDAEAEAAGWRRALHGFSWQDTIHHVGRLVIAPTVGPPDLSFDVDEVSLETSFD
jgi:hypothetical protein